MLSVVPFIGLPEVLFPGALAIALGISFSLRRCAVRAKSLECAVRLRTGDLERERAREVSRNRILELLVTNQSLDVILAEIADLVRVASPDSACAIALRRGDKYFLASASGASPGMLAALGAEFAIPFEVWKGSTDFQMPSADPAWRIFLANLSEPAPHVIRTRAIGTPDRILGACLLFERSGGPSFEGLSIPGAEPLQQGARLAQLAVEHSRFCDDLNFQAHHDTLTGLPNRVLFDDLLLDALAEAKTVNRRVAVLCVDLDRFKQINDTMSHRVGDLFLAETAQRMKRASRPGDTVARIGGDEFSVVLTNLGEESEAEGLANLILEAVRQPLSVEGRTVVTTASIGIAIFPDDGTGAEDLKRGADAAMYCAKELGRNRLQVFSTRNDTLDNVRLDQELKRALRERLFTVHYQPKVNADGGFAGMEALLRLDHPVLGQISPVKFIPIAEQSGLIVPLGAWVLDEVCRQIAAWRAVGLGYVPVAVNVSPVQICRPDFAADVEDCLRRHGISPFCIELELTENMLIGSGDETQKQMSYLRGLGIRFSIDDFGTGYSSLSYLHRLR